MRYYSVTEPCPLTPVPVIFELQRLSVSDSLQLWPVRSRHNVHKPDMFIKINVL